MKWRIWLLSLGITFACVFVFWFASAQVYYNSSVDVSKEHLSVYMLQYDKDLYNLDKEGAVAFSEKLGGARVTFMNMSGDVLADSNAEGPLENHRERQEVRLALIDGDGYSVRGSSTLGKNMVYFCKNFGDRLVRIATFTDSDWTIFARTLPTFITFTGVMLALSAVVAYFTAQLVLNPVKQITLSAMKNDTVESKYPELEQIAEILNERNRDIKRRIDDLQAEKELVERARISKDEFISNITHEMNTPLTSIHGYAELLDGGLADEEKRKTAYKTILVQSERLTNLITCIINYSEIENDDLPSYEVDFSALARETIRALKPEADKRKITIEDKIEDNVIIVSRHERLSEIIGNLLRNAIKYNKDGGKIIVTLNFRELSIEDTGIGIAEENMSKVFSRFFTVDKSHGGKNGGFGLGLAVAKKICLKSGWRITVQSKLDEGSKFTVRF